MELKEYRKKRNFQKSPEPSGKKTKKPGSENPLSFVVHKHRASHLHYDLRLELNGVLKSWAIPKGPTLDPDEKRLSMMVEDHPLDYRTFEGVIPEGNYGAGSVMIWDFGSYHEIHSQSRAESEAALNTGLEKGHISFILDGKKLGGEFALVRLKRAGDNSWLLIKKHDGFAGKTRPSDEDRSAASGKSMQEIAAAGDIAGYQEKKPDSNGSDLFQSSKQEPLSEPINLDDAPVSEMPSNIRPMLATLVDNPFDRPGWLFEIKWDGYRAIAEIRDHTVRFYTRNLLSLNLRFPAIVDSLRKLPFNAVLDGEVVVLNDEGKAEFQLLQNYLRTGRGNLFYYIFDILYLEGRNLCGFPLRRRKYVLRQLLTEISSENSNLRISDHIEEDGTSLFEAVARQGIEGIVAKDGSSPYRPGIRGREWLKIKTKLQQEAVIGGFTAPRGGRKHLGALVLGIYKGGDFVYIGHSGGGFSDQQLADIRAALDPLITGTCPFKIPPKTNAAVTWVRPELVCEVQFSEWTDEGIMRQPVFLELREDKNPKEVRKEEPVKTPVAVSRRHLKIAGNEKKRITIGGINLELSHLDKIFWPEEGITKGELIEYYRAVAPVMIKYLKDRPESMHRFPNGIEGDSFFQKNTDDRLPGWIETVLVHSDSEDRDIRYLLCQNEAALIYIANLGCIEINPWNARFQSPDYPDYMVFDIDPLDIAFNHVVDAALATRDVLESVGATCFCKTSGATGLHVYVPVGAKYSTEQVQQFANLINILVHGKLPQTTSLKRPPEARENRVYLDYLQNRRGQTMAAPYCVRPRKGATVSAPLQWGEVNRKLNPIDYNIKTMRERLDSNGDLWQNTLGPGIDMESCLNQILHKK
jgi:bifunctional non-homologous end joining protein LigD